MAKSKKKIENPRPSKDEYYLSIADEMTKRSTCLGYRVAAIIVRDDQIVSAGYSGAPRKTKDCIERGFCIRRKFGIVSGTRYEFCRSVHAEQNAIINAARAGVSLLGGDMYIFGYKSHNNQRELTGVLPCYICKKMIINAGLNRVICCKKGGGYKIFTVKDWVKNWQKYDLNDDPDHFDMLGVTYEDKDSKKKK